MADTNISDEAVREATGADWGTWFARLDADGCMEMQHAAIAKHVAEAYGTSPWWCQMVTVQYERDRGLRAVNQAAQGWQFSKQRTLAIDAEAAFEAVQALPGWRPLVEDEEVNLGFGPCTVRRVDHDMIRLWLHEPAGKSVLEIWFHQKGDKTAVLFAHSAIQDEAALPAWKDRWAALLKQL